VYEYTRGSCNGGSTFNKEDRLLSGWILLIRIGKNIYNNVSLRVVVTDTK